MPAYKIETTHTLPIFRHGTSIADTPVAACKAALADENWESPRKNYDSSGEIHLTGIWEGENTVYAGSAISVPSQFDDPIQRCGRHFEILLGLLKMMYHDARAARWPLLGWFAKYACAIARSEAILAGSPDPDASVDPPKPGHGPARLQEEHVRSAKVTVLDVDDRFHQIR